MILSLVVGGKRIRISVRVQAALLLGGEVFFKIILFIYLYTLIQKIFFIDYENK